MAKKDNEARAARRKALAEGLRFAREEVGTVLLAHLEALEDRIEALESKK
jgi:hypothetical protein